MDRKQFINKLKNELNQNDVENVKDILNEYENHFEEGKREGKTEEEISQNLGNPEVIASEYASNLEKEFEVKKMGRNFRNILAIAICCVVLIVALIVLVPIVSNKLDDRTITIKYDQNELSLMSVEEDNVNDFRFISEEFEVNKGDEFYIAIEQKEGYVVKSVKIDGKDVTSSLLSYNDSDKLKNLPDSIKNLIMSNDDSVFIKIKVNSDMNIEIVSE